jgi:hypothetical protein
VEDADFTDDFCRFIQTTIPSVDAAEVLLFVKRRADATWTPAAVGAELRPTVQLNDAEAAKYLDGFLQQGVVALTPEGRFQFKPRSEEIEMYAEMLALAYRVRPVTLIRMIYALRDSRIRTFADAFRLRRN